MDSANQVSLAYRVTAEWYSWFHLTIDAVLGPNIPWRLRWLMLISQPSTFLSYLFAVRPWIQPKPYTVDWLPISPGRAVRVLVFVARGNGNGNGEPAAGSTRKLRPLHLDVHGGAFIGGRPESDEPFCARLAEQTGAVVVSTSYRFAPRHPFPATLDDVAAVLAYLRAHAEARYGADPDLVTVSGSSAGSNLALGASLSGGGPAGPVKASVTFYAPLDLRVPPMQKPRPAAVPPDDNSFGFMVPLLDCYAEPVRHRERHNPRLNPAIARFEDLPEHMLLVVPGVDILAAEQMAFVERLKREAARDQKHAGRKICSLYVSGEVHGWLEFPSSVVPPERKDPVLRKAVDFIREVHAQYGWRWDV